MKLSWKCRSGRERLRDGFQRFSGRGGEMPHTFSDDERVAAKDDGDVVMPTGEPPAFVVIETELAFQILICPLGSPALHDKADELFSGPAVRK